MGTIASLAVGLSLNPTDYLTGLDRAGRKMEAFGKDIGKFAALPGNALKGLSSLPVRAVDGFLGPIKGLLTSIPLIGGMFAAVPASAAEFTHWIKSTIGDMADMVKTSQKVGVSVAGMSAIMVGSGLGTEDLTKNLNHLTRELGNVQMGDKGAISKFGKLGFDPEELAELGTEGALRVIADRMAGLHTGTERATMAFQIFGKSGADLIPLLSRGSAGLDAAAAKAKALGLSFNQVDAQSILQANRAFGMIGQMLTGIGRQIAIQVAPLIAFAGKKFMDWATSGQSVGDIVGSVFDGIEKGIAVLMDVWNMAVGVFKTGASTIAEGLALVLDEIGKMMDGLAKIPIAGKGFVGLGDDFRSWANTARSTAQSLSAQADASFKAPSNLEKLHKFLDDLKQSAVATGKAMVGTGADAKSLAESAKHFEKMEKGEELAKSMATPLEKFQENVNELNALVDDGALSWDVYARGVAKATDELMAHQDVKLAKGPEALTAGSAAAMQAVSKANREGKGGDIQQQMKALQERQFVEQQRANQLAEQMLEVFEDLGLANLTKK